jgi:hypothetical protein
MHTCLCYEGDDEVATPESGPAVRGVQQKQTYLHHHRIYEGVYTILFNFQVQGFVDQKLQKFFKN